jgi:hypothetical protein
MTNAYFAVETDCSPSSRWRITLQTAGTTPIMPDLTFDFEDNSGGEFSGSYIRGQLDTVGNAKGTVHIAASFDYSGTHYNCLFDTEWTAKRGA